MLGASFTHNGATYEVRPLTVKQNELARYILHDFVLTLGAAYDIEDPIENLPATLSYLASKFIGFMTTTKITGDAPFDVVPFVGANDAALINMFSGWHKATDEDDELYSRWIAMYDQVHGADTSDAAKKNE